MGEEDEGGGFVTGERRAREGATDPPSGYEIRETAWKTEDFVVVRAVRLSGGQRVLLKVPAIRPPSPRVLEALENEARLARLLDGAHVLLPQGVERLPEGPVLVLADFEGTPLDPSCFPLETGRLLDLACNLARALGHVHTRGLVHLDLRPENVLLGEAGLRLTGFSLATPEGHPPMEPEHLEGPLPFMSPEQMGRTRHSVDRRSDFYSLGILLYLASTGQFPFHGRDPLEWIHCHVAAEPRPPRDLNSSLPEVVSDLVLKLLAKSPEERYQADTTLRADLERCLDDWRTSGGIEGFPLGRGDAEGRFRDLHRLYGRDREISELRAALERASSRGGAEFFVLAGYSGIGKTSLVEEVAGRVRRENGIFLSGKFDQYRRDIPFDPLVQALGDFVRRLLGRGEEEVEAWRARLLAAVGLNGRLITEAIPQVQLLLGEQPPVAELPMTEAQHRFHSVLRQFLDAFCWPGHPLVLFLDDLQWADPASLRFLQALLAPSNPSHLLLVGAYRDNEVGSSHPLARALESLRRSGAVLRELTLGPLSVRDLEDLVADTLGAAPEHTAPLADLVHQKTGGNPFFSIQFLRALRDEALLRHDADEGAWTWDLAAIHARGFTDNVVDLMIRKLSRLSPESQEVLKCLACTGGHGSLSTLALLGGGPPQTASLDEALAEGLVLRENGSFGFLHDRVQQAAYSLIPERDREALHLSVARLLAQAGGGTTEDVFNIVGQFNRAASLIESPQERELVARLNLEAGSRAKASTAYQSAAEYLSAGLALLGPESWATHDRLAFGLHIELAESLWLQGNLGEAEERFQRLLEQDLGKLDRARVHRDLIEVNTAQGRMLDALRQCQRCLALFGVDLPLDPSPARVDEEHAALWRALGNRTIEDLVDLPSLEDPEMRAALDAMAAIIPAAIFTSEGFLCLLVCLMAHLSISHGNGQSAPSAYVYLGMVLGPRFGRYREAYRFGKLAYALVERGLVAWKSRVFIIFGNVISFWTRPMRENLGYIHAAFEAAQELGDLSGACYCWNHLLTAMLALGEPLDEVHEESTKGLDFVRRAHYWDIVDILVSHQRFTLNMLGRTSSFSSFSDEGFDEAEFEARIEQSQMALLAFWHQVLKLQARFLSGDLGAALGAGRKAQELLWSSPAHLQIPEFHLYYALALAASVEGAPEAEKGALLEAFQEHRRPFGEWAQNCPENFRHKHELLEAEAARLEGRVLEAQDLYEKAIRSTRESGFVHLEGVANERASLFYRARGFQTSADAYLGEARNCYVRWGAEGKVRDLERRYPRLTLRQPVEGVDLRSTLPARAERIDLLAVIKASRAISGEMLLADLAETLLATALEAAGAQSGILLVPQDGDLGPVAAARMVEGEVRTSREIPPGADLLPPRGLLNYVSRTREAAILEDASQPNPFSEAFEERPSRSVLCLPILKRGAVVGVLYLENRLLSGVFTADRVAFLELLAAQSAISLENARLYGELREALSDLEQENRERRRAEEALKALNDALEARVRERTAQLESANEELKSFSYSVSHDLRSPLLALSGFSEILLEDQADRLDATGRDYLERIFRAAQRIGRILEGLQMLSGLGLLEFRVREVDLSSMALSILEDLQRQEPGRAVAAVVEPGLSVQGDERLLRLALENLLGNAWKFTSRRPEARIAMGRRSHGDREVFYLEDNGVGFDPAEAEQAFAPFRRLQGAAEYPGTGVGLAIVRRVFQRHGGRVWAEGIAGRGATFYFELEPGAKVYP